MKKIVLILLFALIELSKSCFCQELPGFNLSNNMSIYRATFNPSAIVGTKYKAHVNVVTINSTINGRYFKYFTSDALLHGIKAPYTTSELYGKSKVIASYTQGDINMATELRGPSFYYSISPRIAIGFQCRMRGFEQGFGFAEALRYAYFWRLDDDYYIKPAAGAGSAFLLNQHSFFETGLTLAGVLIDTDAVRLKIGASAKRLSGARSVFWKGSFDRYQIVAKPNTNPTEFNLELTNLQYSYGYSQPTKENFEASDLFSNSYGSGWAWDAGLTVEIGRARDPRPHRANYALRLGAALTDAGAIQYATGGRAVKSVSSAKFIVDQTRLEALINNAPKTLDTWAANAPKTTFGRETQLPKNLNIDADLQVLKTFFVNVSYTKSTRQSFSETDIRQPQTLTITPRFEDADAEFSMPVSWIEGNDAPSVGLALRVGPAFIGFSNFSGMLGIHSPRGTMACLGVNVFHFQKKKEKQLTQK